MFLGLIFFLVVTPTALVDGERDSNMTSCAIRYHKNASDAHHQWLAIPMNTMFSVSIVIMIITTVEFIYAQTPHQIKSFVIQTTFLFIMFFSSLGELVTQIWKKFPEKYFPSCVFYLDLLHTIFALVSFILFAFIAKRYKLRVRDDIIPYHMFAEEFVENDMKRREAFYSQRELQMNAHS